MDNIIYEKISRNPHQYVKIIYFDIKTGERPDKIPKHWHRSLEVIYPLKGGSQLWENGNLVEIGPNDIHVINSRSIHTFINKGPREYQGYAIQIDYKFAQLLYPQIDNVTFTNDLSQEVKQKIISLLDSLVKVTRQEFSNIIANGYATILIGEMLSHMATIDKDKSPRSSKNSQVIADIINYIDINFADKISPRFIADEFNLSYGYLARLFKEGTGLTLKQYIDSQRLESAVIDLQSSDLNITQIALKNGFSDYKSFDRIFKERYSIKPSAYKEKFVATL